MKSREEEGREEGEKHREIDIGREGRGENNSRHPLSSHS